MELFYAHYAALEKSFLQFVQQHRRPLEPWLVVCASSLLSRQLSSQLARSQGAVANIHFCTLSSLLQQVDAQAGPALPVFPQNQLRDFLIKDILTQPGLDVYPASRGLVSALKSSLRDLADSLVDPAVLEEQLYHLPDEGPAAQDKARFAWLVRVYQCYLQREAQVPGYRPYQAFFERALSQVPQAAYLKQFSKIILYGFYDMPGRQLELVHQLRAHYPLTVFAPYAKYPAYQFAQKFFETNWLGMSHTHTDHNTDDWGALGTSATYLFDTQGQCPAKQVQLVSAASMPSEVFFVAKEILRLVEQEGYAFEDIGVLARTQGPYQDQVRRIFAQNKIPLNASYSYGLQQFPLGVFCMNLFGLAARGFDRQTVLSLLSSPYFKGAAKHAWYAVAEKSLVSMHLSQWQDLLPALEGFDPAFLEWLEKCRYQLHLLMEPGSWEQKSALAQQFLTDHLAQQALQGKELEIYQQVCACIESLAGYGVVRAECRAGEFLQELTDALNGLVFHEVQTAARGVVFTDVLRARGLGFKVVFVLGVNEKVFPQIVPDDPIFRDRYRYIVRDVLGYWVSQKAERTQEERLLFFSAVTAAQERVYVSYATHGADGKALVPSVYAAELARVAELTWNAEEKPRVSGLWSARLSHVDPLFYTPKETSAWIMLSRKSVVEQYQQAGLFTPDIDASVQAAQALHQTQQLGKFDGCIESGKEIFQAGQRAGFSPSALQDLAACPMKYFFRKGLHLADPEDPCSRDTLAPNTRGTIYHQVLEDFYKQLQQLGLTHQLFASGLAEYLDRALAKHYTAQSYRLFGIYPVVWELILSQIREQLVAFVQEEMVALGTFTPTYFEKEFTALDVENFPLRLRGVIDRIDVDEPHKRFIIADYKSSRKGPSDLAKAFFSHLIFQPFLYPLAAAKLPALTEFSLQGACLLAINKGYDRRDISAEELAALRPHAQAFLERLARLMNEGTFFLNPSELCTYCPYSAICRKDSFSCLMRARKSAPSQQLEEARYGD